jgi:hypothetical protein
LTLKFHVTLSINSLRGTGPPKEYPIIGCVYWMKYAIRHYNVKYSPSCQRKPRSLQVKDNFDEPIAIATACYVSGHCWSVARWRYFNFFFHQFLERHLLSDLMFVNLFSSWIWLFNTPWVTLNNNNQSIKQTSLVLPSNNPLYVLFCSPFFIHWHVQLNSEIIQIEVKQVLTAPLKL